jgi:hypothetical protein
MDREIASRLGADPALVEIARRNLKRWLDRPRLPASLKRCYLEWQTILDSYSPAELLRLLKDDGEEAQRLRQNSPFVGILTPLEVREFKRRFRHASRTT